MVLISRWRNNSPQAVAERRPSFYFLCMDNSHPSALAHTYITTKATLEHWVELETRKLHSIWYSLLKTNHMRWRHNIRKSRKNPRRQTAELELHWVFDATNILLSNDYNIKSVMAKFAKKIHLDDDNIIITIKRTPNSCQTRWFVYRPPKILFLFLCREISGVFATHIA